jgi:hypothetical protein
MSDVMERPDTVPMKPVPSKPIVLAHRRMLEMERDALRAGAIELALASARGDLSARSTLAALPAKLAALQFEIDLSHQAQELAHAEDATAETAWRASLQLMDPEDLIAGISGGGCCHLCQPNVAGGCVLSAAAPYSGSTCMHPTRMGSFHQFNIDNSGLRIFPYRNNPQAAKVFYAACDKLKVRGKFL